MTTAVEACKLGFAGFMVPFAFCYNPAMMMQGSVGEIISVAISADHRCCHHVRRLPGLAAVEAPTGLKRLVFIAGGLLMFTPAR